MVIRKRKYQRQQSSIDGRGGREAAVRMSCKSSKAASCLQAEEESELSDW